MPFRFGPVCPKLALIMGSSHQVPDMGFQLPTFIKVWFAVDLVLALFPPVHWAMSGSDSILGIPRALLYVYGTSSVIAASIVAAYFADRTIRTQETGNR